MREEVFAFGPGRSMVGVASIPPALLGAPAVVLPNAGLLPRVGPNRLHVRLARALTELGYLALRFDLQGLGDSEIEGASAGDLAADTSAAIDLLQSAFGARRFVALGICTGAVAAYRCAVLDARVEAVALLNPLGLEVEGELGDGVRAKAQSRFYLTRALRDPERWRRVLTGRTSYRRVAATVGARLREKIGAAPCEPPFIAQLRADLARLLARGARALVVHTEWGAESDLLGLLNAQDLQRQFGADSLLATSIADCDHTFTPLRCQERLLAIVNAWAAGVCGGVQEGPRLPTSESTATH